ncbi:MAG: alginate export family protein [Steroidobacteraceae bacterium]
MKRRAAWLLAAGTLLACVANAESLDGHEQPPDLTAALLQGELRFNFRYRFEHVDDDALADAAEASTLRSRFYYRSAGWRRWSALLEIDDVQSIGNDLYNSTRNGATDLPLVADPEGTEINQATLQYSASRYSLALGRQRLNLDNQRFVGASAWRQNEQTFDALSARYRLPSTDISYSHAANVNRSLGPNDGTPPADLRGRMHLLTVKQDARALGSLTAFVYSLDFDNAAALSSRTLGLRWTGNYPLVGELRALQATAWARQSEAGDNPADFTSDYWQIELGLKLRAWSLALGRETLEGDPVLPDRSFQTPLATQHVFQGWADKFTTTPAAGIEDTYVALAGSSGDLKVQLVWHDFAAQAVERDYGEEWDASVSYLVAKRYELLLKVADYSSDGFSTDTTKLWLQLSASF